MTANTSQAPFPVVPLNDPSPGAGSMGDTTARENWDRYWYVKGRGHVEYCEQAKLNEGFYLGGGLQWRHEDRELLEEQGRRAIELNEILDSVNSAIGYQINNRLDIAYTAKGQGANDDIAATLSKVAMQVSDDNKLPWVETQVFSDGLIQQRGYFDIRMKFDNNLKGDISIEAMDPMDVIPDPDAKTYDPDGWADVTTTRWMTLDDIEGMYGSDARAKVEAENKFIDERDFGNDVNEIERNRFGDEFMGYGTEYDAYYTENRIQRVRVVDRQMWKMTDSRVLCFPTGEVRVAHNPTPDRLAAWRKGGVVIMRRPTRRVRWIVSTAWVTLHDEWSPYDHFTIVPFFALFRRGRTRGMVDNLIGPQEMVNKSASQFMHIVNSAANSGWMVEQQSLTNMRTDELEDDGARTGLILEYRKGATPPKKIDANQVPTGVDKLLTIGSDKIKGISGQSDSMRGQGKEDASGVSVQSQQFGAQMSQAIILDNLGRTRHLIAGRMLELIQTYYDEPRLIRVQKTDLNGQTNTQEVRLNWQQTDGVILNDLTLGEYGVAISEVPAQITYENSQYQQALDMKKAGVNIPDAVLIRTSTLNNKAELLQDMAQQGPQLSPLDQAKAVLAQAQATLAQSQTAVNEANAANARITSLFTAQRVAQVVTDSPATAGMADEIARASGFKDMNAVTDQPIPIPTPEQVAASATPTPAPGAPADPTAVPSNTDPLKPATPTTGADAGADAGIKGGAAGALPSLHEAHVQGPPPKGIKT